MAFDDAHFSGITPMAAGEIAELLGATSETRRLAEAQAYGAMVFIGWKAIHVNPDMAERINNVLLGINITISWNEILQAWEDLQ